MSYSSYLCIASSFNLKFLLCSMLRLWWTSRFWWILTGSYRLKTYGFPVKSVLFISEIFLDDSCFSSCGLLLMLQLETERQTSDGDTLPCPVHDEIAFRWRRPWFFPRPRWRKKICRRGSWKRKTWLRNRWANRQGREAIRWERREGGSGRGRDTLSKS